MENDTHIPSIEEMKEDPKCPCNYCDSVETCDYAWDAYNTNGDCLAIK